MLPDNFYEPEEQELPKCQECNDDCVVGYNDCIMVDESEMYCSTICFCKAMMANTGAEYV